MIWQHLNLHLVLELCISKYSLKLPAIHSLLISANLYFAVGSDAGGQPFPAQQWEALLESDQLGPAQPVGERRSSGETDGGGQYKGPLWPLSLLLLLPNPHLQFQGQFQSRRFCFGLCSFFCVCVFCVPPPFFQSLGLENVKRAVCAPILNIPRGLSRGELFKEP